MSFAKSILPDSNLLPILSYRKNWNPLIWKAAHIDIFMQQQDDNAILFQSQMISSYKPSAIPAPFHFDSLFLKGIRELSFFKNVFTVLLAFWLSHYYKVKQKIIFSTHLSWPTQSASMCMIIVIAISPWKASTSIVKNPAYNTRAKTVIRRPSTVEALSIRVQTLWLILRLYNYKI